MSKKELRQQRKALKARFCEWRGVNVTSKRPHKEKPPQQRKLSPSFHSLNHLIDRSKRKHSFTRQISCSFLSPLENNNPHDCNAHPKSLAPFPGLLLYAEPAKQLYSIGYSKLGYHDQHHCPGRS